MPKSWCYEPVFPGYESLLFYNAMQKHSDGYYYHPVALAKREEIGIKYRFLCIAVRNDAAGTDSHFADIEIYKPSAGIPYVTCLYRMNYDAMFPHRGPYF